MQNSCLDLLLVKKQGEEQHYNVLPSVYLKRRGRCMYRLSTEKHPQSGHSSCLQRGIRV